MELQKSEIKLYAECVENLPKKKEMIPLYLDILENTNNHIIRNGVAYLIASLSPEEPRLKSLLINLIRSTKTENSKGSLLYVMQFLDYSDNESIDMLCEQLAIGNWECRHEAYLMIEKVLPLLTDESCKNLEQKLNILGETTAERLDFIEHLYNLI